MADKSDRDRKMEAPPLFKPDDRVLVRREMLQAKLEDLYDGPFRVISGPDERGNYKLRDLHNNQATSGRQERPRQENGSSAIV